MIVVPFRDLRVALQNPSAYVKAHKDAAAKQMRRSKYLVLRDAVFQYHSDGLQQAQNYLEAKFGAFKSQADLPEYILRLSTYAKEFKKLGTTVIRTRINVSLNLPVEIPNCRVTGQIPRLDLSNGYSAWVFVRGDTDWAADPRMPLLQDAVARNLSVDLDDVEIGVYDFVVGKHFATKFKPSRVQSVRKKVINLINELTKNA